jgi:hypothetical protein
MLHCLFAPTARDYMVEVPIDWCDERPTMMQFFPYVWLPICTQMWFRCSFILWFLKCHHYSRAETLSFYTNCFCPGQWMINSLAPHLSGNKSSRRLELQVMSYLVLAPWQRRRVMTPNLLEKVGVNQAFIHSNSLDNLHYTPCIEEYFFLSLKVKFHILPMNLIIWFWFKGINF